MSVLCIPFEKSNAEKKCRRNKIMVKYKKAIKEMLDDNQILFDEFKTIHVNFDKDSTNWQDKFNEEGTKTLRIIRRYENNLCSRSENTGFGKFSTNLSNKFWAEVRAFLPLIDSVKISNKLFPLLLGEG